MHKNQADFSAAHSLAMFWVLRNGQMIAGGPSLEFAGLHRRP
jgi:hypothetical protein